jgi:hypothetical protein
MLGGSIQGHLYGSPHPHAESGGFGDNDFHV